jgi:hypothetical protein
LKIYYGKPDPWNGPDTCVAWGPGAPKGDGAFLIGLFCSPRIGYDYKEKGPCAHKWEKAAIEELKERGYDITTLKVSIQRSKVGEDSQS